MAGFRPRVDPSSPGITRQANRYERLLRRALTMAAKRDGRRDPALAALYASAQIEGVDTALRMKKATISFRGPPLIGSWHQIYDWSALAEFAPREIADGISWSLRENLRRARRGA